MWGAKEGGGVAWDELWRRDMSVVLARETARTLVTRVEREAQGVHPTMVAPRRYRGRYRGAKPSRAVSLRE